MEKATATGSASPPAGSSPAGADRPEGAEPEPGYGEMLDRLERVMRRIVPAWLADRRDDLVQAAMLRVMDVARSREQSVSFTSSYLWRTAQSVLIDEIRRARRRPEVDLETAPERPAGSAGPERTLASKELGAAVRDCLDGLHDMRRRVVTLHLLGHTPAEAATRLGFNPKKVYNLIHRGLEDLRACLKRKELAP